MTAENSGIFALILCHGSGNRFALIDAVRFAAVADAADKAVLARSLCSACGGLDGLLLLVRNVDGYGMRMFNPDGSEAEMCGNGIRCVARLARSYVAAERFVLHSGGRPYEVVCEAPLFGDIPTFGVEIPLRLRSSDFCGEVPEGGFVDRPLPELDDRLRFTYLNPGNPHIAAAVDAIDRGALRRLGERVTELGGLFPRGVNVSLYRVCGPQRIYVATFERGAGITASCGTAMTASSTAACLAGRCRWDEPIEVRNAGGMVRCLCRRGAEGLRTRLTGNATFEADARAAIDPRTGEATLCGAPVPRAEEIAAYDAFLRRMNETE